MKAYRIHSPNVITLDEFDALPVGENCVKLKNLICGIASTDVDVYSGKRKGQYPIVPGRQCVGFVSEVGAEVKGVQRGNRVVAYLTASCHNCRACKDSRSWDCEKPLLFGAEENGFLSDFSVVSSDDIYVLPDRVKDEEAIFTEHTAMAINALSALNIDKGEHIVIVGATAVGIILAQVAMYYQAVPIIVDINSELLNVAQNLGVYYTIDPVSEDVGKKILAITGGHMADACAFMPESTLPLHSVFNYCARRGRIAIVGRMDDADYRCGLKEFVDRNLLLMTVIGCGKNYQTAINMLANHTVNVAELPSQIIGFGDVPAKFDSLVSTKEMSDNVFVKI